MRSIKMKLFTLKNWFWVVLAIALGFWAIKYLRQNSLVQYVTFKQGLPRGARVVSIKPTHLAAQDSNSFLIFDAPRVGIESFVMGYCEGSTLETLSKKPDNINGYFTGPVRDLPMWDYGELPNTRFFQRRKGSIGFLVIDLDKNRVFIHR